MKQKISFTTTIITIGLFLALTSASIPWVFFTAFILLLGRGIYWFAVSMSKDIDVNESQPAGNLSKLFFLRLVLLLIPVLYTAAVVFIFLSRKKWWLAYLMNDN